MKKIIILLGIFLITGAAFSQNKTKLIDAEVYQNLKKTGNVPENFQFSNPEIFEPSKVDVAADVANTNRPAGNCGCYVVPDNTYTLALSANDDGSTSSLAIPFNFTLYGTNYTSLFINNNGNVSFGSSYSTFSSNPFPNSGFVMVAPFWGDVDTRGVGTVKYKITPTAMYINWEGVGYYNSETDKVNTFQLIITDGNDPVLPAGNNIAFCYGDMQWTTGSASGGTNGFGGTPATVGVNKGDGVSFIQLGQFDQPGSAYDGGGGANDGVSWLDNQSLYFNVASGTNIAPIANFTPAVFNSGGGACDTLKMCGINDTLLINSLFLSPEIGEITTVSINLNSIPGFTILNNTPGNPASATVQVIASPANAGMNTITYTATDNGTPVQTTVVDLNIFVDTTGLASFNPTILGQLEYCANTGGTTLTVNPTNFTSYIWNTGSVDTTIIVTASGDYWVTSELNGCYKTNNVQVIEHPVPTPLILGPLFNCTGNPSTLYVDSASLYATFSWSNGSTNDSISVSSGSYTVTVIDSFGCTGVSPSVTMSNNIPAVSISGDSTYCQNDSTTLTAIPSILSGANYLWSTGSNNASINIGAVGNVWVTVSYNNGCSASDTINITSIPTFASTQSDTICFGDSYTLPGGTIVTTSGTYIDTLAAITTCDSVVTTVLTVTSPVDATISPAGPFCDNGANVILSAASSGGVWSGTGIINSSTGEFSPSVAGVGSYNIIYTITNGCGGADTIALQVNDSPSFSLSMIEDTCLSSVGSIFSNIIIGNAPYSYLWSRGDVSQDLFNVLMGSYSLTVTDNNSCAKNVQIFVGNIGDDCNIIAPNVITPNGDGLNDVLFFSGLDRFPNSKLEVFNRWGSIVYQKDDYQNDWSPKDFSDGTYFYVLTPGGLGGKNKDPLKGSVSILK